MPKGRESAGRFQPAAERSLVQVVDEGPPTVDFQHGKPFAVARLQLGIAGDVDEFVRVAEARELLLGAVAEAAALRGEEDEARDRGRA